MSTVKHLSEQVLEDLKKQCLLMQKSPREKLAVLVGVAIESGSCNLMEWTARLPKDTAEESRYRYIERFMQTGTICEDEAMQGFAAQTLAYACRNDQTIVLCMDQTSIRDEHGILMVSVRVANRGIPLFWRVKAGKCNIGFDVQKELLEQLDKVLPAGANVLFLGDRFYGTAALIGACQERGWRYRIRLKSNLTLQHEGGELSTGDIQRLKKEGIENAELYGTGVRTNIGSYHEQGHPEPWIIAMDAMPCKRTILDYGLRWSIESMFSDFKTRGFGLEDTHLQKPERVARLLLVLAIAMFWVVCIGINRQKLKKTLAP